MTESTGESARFNRMGKGRYISGRARIVCAAVSRLVCGRCEHCPETLTLPERMPGMLILRTVPGRPRPYHSTPYTACVSVRPLVCGLFIVVQCCCCCLGRAGMCSLARHPTTPIVAADG